jgi:hypothetical protein
LIIGWDVYRSVKPRQHSQGFFETFAFWPDYFDVSTIAWVAGIIAVDRADRLAQFCE